MVRVAWCQGPILSPVDKGRHMTKTCWATFRFQPSQFVWGENNHQPREVRLTFWTTTANPPLRLHIQVPISLPHLSSVGQSDRAVGDSIPCWHGLPACPIRIISSAFHFTLFDLFELIDTCRCDGGGRYLTAEVQTSILTWLTLEGLVVRCNHRKRFLGIHLHPTGGTIVISERATHARSFFFKDMDMAGFFILLFFSSFLFLDGRRPTAIDVPYQGNSLVKTERKKKEILCRCGAPNVKRNFVPCLDVFRNG